MFEITNEQAIKLNAWCMQQDEIVCKQQLHSSDAFIRKLAQDGEAYYGACGGELTYSFTPTSLGLSTKVTHSVTKAEIDLTDYASW
jgi:hypothetical protein